MPDTIISIEDINILVCDPQGPKIEGESDATNLIGEMFEAGARWIVVPVERLTGDFFELKTKVAGDIIHKFVLYQRRLVVLGDITPYTSTSRSFRDFVYEANRGNQFWFLPNMEEFAKRLK